MGSFLKNFRSNSTISYPSTAASPAKKEQNVPVLTPLEKRLLDMGPIRDDGSDKFYGMENYGNTCYCNSILQCLYYSVPFREAVVNYPIRTPIASLEAALAKSLKFQNPISPQDAEAQAAKQRTTNGQSSARSAGVPPTQPQKPEDKDSPEYKKKMALQTLPILETKNNSMSYGMSESLFTALKDIFESIAGSQTRVGIVRPQQFLEVLRREHEMFRSAMHQDAHEFLNLLLNEVVSNVEDEVKKLPIENGLPQSKSADSLDRATGSTGSKTPNTTRWVHELFEGTLTSETQCLTCEKVSQRDEIFLDLSVDLEQHSSVTSCLRKFSAEEMLCERNKFHCDNCGGLQEAEKRMKIKRLPRVLALHLKRFKYTEDLQRLQKLFHRVVYPYHLRLFNTTDDAEDPDRLYELYAVVVHIGGGPYHGHYVAIIKTQDRGWLLFDDELVEPVDKNYVRNFFGDRPGLACAYVLFYQETTLEAMMKEQETENTAPPMGSADINELALKQNGSPLSPGLTHVHSVTQISPFDDTNRVAHLKRIPTPREQTEPEVTTSLPPPPIPPTPPTSPPPRSTTPPSHVRASLPVRLHTREEKDRKAAEKNEKTRRKESDMQSKENHKREETELKTAIEASKASKADEDRRKLPREQHGSKEKNETHKRSGGLSRFRRSSKSISHILTKEKEKPLPTKQPAEQQRGSPPQPRARPVDHQYYKPVEQVKSVDRYKPVEQVRSVERPNMPAERSNYTARPYKSAERFNPIERSNKPVERSNFVARPYEQSKPGPKPVEVLTPVQRPNKLAEQFSPVERPNHNAERFNPFERPKPSEQFSPVERPNNNAERFNPFERPKLSGQFSPVERPKPSEQFSPVERPNNNAERFNPFERPKLSGQFSPVERPKPSEQFSPAERPWQPKSGDQSNPHERAPSNGHVHENHHHYHPHLHHLRKRSHTLEPEKNNERGHSKWRHFSLRKKSFGLHS